MKLLKRIINWVLGLFQKSETPEIDAKIKKKQEKLKDLDRELKDEYTGVDEALEEWKK